ncbi:hypothetical protein GCM10020229_15580 [Kitasatospora albolonga]
MRESAAAWQSCVRAGRRRGRVRVRPQRGAAAQGSGPCSKRPAAGRPWSWSAGSPGRRRSARREAPFQGLTEETTLAGLLLAVPGVEDVWQQWEIKRANFDNLVRLRRPRRSCAAGVEATPRPPSRAGEHPEREALLERLLGEDGKPCVSEHE